MSKPTIHMSRAFVEFGPFTLEEFHAFKNRGILRETDYFRKDGESTWMHVFEFASSHPLLAKPQKEQEASATKAAATRSKDNSKSKPASSNKASTSISNSAKKAAPKNK
jgi:hypothetical protein